jgi:N-acetylglucosaminyldiphosphoundecaprenol N-acetyl-beta-D-mannosaminyltransferase
MEHDTKQKVASEQVRQLRSDFRQAVLKSTARELQKQEVAHVKQHVATLDSSIEGFDGRSGFDDELFDARLSRISQQVEILNVSIDNFTISDFLTDLKKGVVFTPNVDHLMKLQRDQEFVEAYKQADFRVCDSQVLVYASKFLGTPIKAKISGSDLFPRFCEHHKDNENIKIFLLGGAEGVPQRAQKRINYKIGRRIIVAAHSPSFGFEKDEAECQAIIDMIKQSDANVLVVGLGAPKQEKWIARYRHHLPNIDIFLAVGASIDFEAGNKPRAPQFISELGLEWMYRLASEPRRLWKRYLVDDLPFLLLLLREKLSRLRQNSLPPTTYGEAAD